MYVWRGMGVALNKRPILVSMLPSQRIHLDASRFIVLTRTAWGCLERRGETPLQRPELTGQISVYCMIVCVSAVCCDQGDHLTRISHGQHYITMCHSLLCMERSSFEQI